jgi:hypothetical protein
MNGGNTCNLHTADDNEFASGTPDGFTWDGSHDGNQITAISSETYTVQDTKTGCFRKAGVSTVESVATFQNGTSEDAEAEVSDWMFKKPLPSNFQHGEILGVSCWSERYQAVTNIQKDDGTFITKSSMKCVDGTWVGADGSPGLANFSCGRCMQVGGAGYGWMQAAEAQELYFANKIRISIMIDIPPGGGTSKSITCLAPKPHGPFHVVQEMKDGDALVGNDHRDSDHVGAWEEMTCMNLANLAIERASPEADTLLRRLRIKGLGAEGDLCFEPTQGAKVMVEDKLVKQFEENADYPADAWNQKAQGAFAFQSCAVGKTEQGFYPSFLGKLLHNVANYHYQTSHISTQKIDKMSTLYAEIANCFGAARYPDSMLVVHSIVWQQSPTSSIEKNVSCTWAPLYGKDEHAEGFQEQESSGDAYLGFFLPATCPDGHLFRYISLRRSEAKYFTQTWCRPVISLGKCSTYESEQITLVVDTATQSLPSLNAKCPEHHGLQSLNYEESSGGEWIRTQYTCCMYDNVPFSILPEKLERDYIDPREGIYCPSELDTSGRPTYALRGFIPVEGDLTGATPTMWFSQWEMKWCIDYSKSSVLAEDTGCFDFPIGWRDSIGKNCSTYEGLASSRLCYNGTYGSAWTTGDTFADYGSNGYDASTACCACGGGRRHKICYPVSDATTPDSVDSFSDDVDNPAVLEVVPMTDMRGEFLTPKPQTKRPKRKPPKLPPLMVFKGGNADYARECKDEILNQKDGPANLYKQFEDEGYPDDWEANPCAGITGAGDPVSDASDAQGLTWKDGIIGGGEGKTHSGVTKEDIWGCFNRAAGRDTVAHTEEGDWAQGAGIRDLVEKTIGMIFDIIPDTGAGLGAFLAWDWGDSGEGIGEVGESMIDFSLEQMQADRQTDIFTEDSNDCDPHKLAFAKLFCDIHCVRDAVVEGNRAILDDLGKATRLTNDNMKSLAMYLDRKGEYNVLEARDMILDALGQLNSEDQKLIERGPSAIQNRILQSFSRFGEILKVPLTPGGAASVGRSLREYMRDVNAVGAHASNESEHFNALTRLVGKLSASIEHTSTMPTSMSSSKAGSLSVVVKERAELMQRYFRYTIRRMGRWRTRLSHTRRMHRDLVAGSSANVQVQMEFDKVVWALHAAFDEYLAASDDEQTNSMAALDTLRLYQSCGTSFKRVSSSYKATAASERNAKAVLSRVWATILPKLGLLQAIIRDGDMFATFVDEDSRRVNQTAWREAMSSSPHSNSTAGVTCPFKSKAGKQALRRALTKEALVGVTGDFQHQVHAIVTGVYMLESRLRQSGVVVSSTDGTTIRDAVNAMQRAFNDSIALDSRGVENLAARLLPSMCTAEDLKIVTHVHADSVASDMYLTAEEVQLIKPLIKAVRAGRALLASQSSLASRPTSLLQTAAVPDSHKKAPPPWATVMKRIINRTSKFEARTAGLQAPVDSTDAAPSFQVKGLHDNLGKHNGFEGCSLADMHSTRHAANKTSRAAILSDDASVMFVCGTNTWAAGQCYCNPDEITLESVSSALTPSPGVVRQSCCPRSSLQCAGCAVFQDGKCIECEGGYGFDHDGRCTSCMDIQGWSDASGNSCAHYGGASPSAKFQKGARQCTNMSTDKYKGISSIDACCACGGGHAVATPFVYVTESVALGLPEETPTAVGYPVPRTAERYGLSQDCTLGMYGITMNPLTGQLSGHVRNNASFDVVCTVTAFQSGDLQANATLKFSGRAGYNYPSDLVMFPNSGMIPKTTETFKSNLLLDDASFAMLCTPDLPWLSLDKSSGNLEATHAATNASGALTDVSGLNGVSGGVCFIRNEKDSKDPGQRLTIFYPTYWTSLEYSPAETVTVVGDEITLVAPKPVVGIAPPFYELACNSSDGVDFTYDGMTGIAFVGGKEAFLFDPLRGTVSGVPSSSLLQEVTTVISLASGGEEREMLVRQEIVLNCVVSGMAPTQVESLTRQTAVVQGLLTLRFVDNTCWTEVDAKGHELFPYETTVTVTHPEHTSDSACRKQCMKAGDCTHYRFRDHLVGSSDVDSPCTTWNAASENQRRRRERRRERRRRVRRRRTRRRVVTAGSPSSIKEVYTEVTVGTCTSVTAEDCMAIAHFRGYVFQNILSETDLPLGCFADHANEKMRFNPANTSAMECGNAKACVCVGNAGQWNKKYSCSQCGHGVSHGEAATSLEECFEYCESNGANFATYSPFSSAPCECSKDCAPEDMNRDVGTCPYDIYFLGLQVSDYSMVEKDARCPSELRLVEQAANDEECKEKALANSHFYFDYSLGTGECGTCYSINAHSETIQSSNGTNIYELQTCRDVADDCRQNANGGACWYSITAYMSQYCQATCGLCGNNALETTTEQAVYDDWWGSSALTIALVQNTEVDFAQHGKAPDDVAHRDTHLKFTAAARKIAHLDAREVHMMMHEAHRLTLQKKRTLALKSSGRKQHRDVKAALDAHAERRKIARAAFTPSLKATALKVANSRLTKRDSDQDRLLSQLMQGPRPRGTKSSVVGRHTSPKLSLFQETTTVNSTFLKKTAGIWWNALDDLLAISKVTEPLQACLNSLNDTKYHVNEMTQFFSTGLLRPIKMVLDTMNVYVNPSIKEIMKWGKKMGAGKMANITNKTKQRVQTSHAEEGDSFLKELVDGTVALVDEVVALPEQGFSYCLWNVITKPILTGQNSFLNPFLKTVAELVNPLIYQWKWLMEAVVDFVADIFKRSIEENGVLRLLLTYAEEEVATQCQRATNKAEKDLHDVRVFLRQPRLGDAQQQYRKSVTALEKPIEYKRVIGNALAKIIKQYLPVLNEQFALPMLLGFEGAVKNLMPSVLHSVDALCGLIPYVGAQMCSVLGASVESGLEQIAPEMIDKAKTLIAQFFNEAGDFVANEVSKAFAQFDVSAFTEGPTKIIAMTIHDLALRLVPDVQDAVTNCDSAKNLLVQSFDLAAKNHNLTRTPRAPPTPWPTPPPTTHAPFPPPPTMRPTHPHPTSAPTPPPTKAPTPAPTPYPPHLPATITKPSNQWIGYSLSPSEAAFGGRGVVGYFFGPLALLFKFEGQQLIQGIRVDQAVSYKAWLSNDCENYERVVLYSGTDVFSADTIFDEPLYASCAKLYWAETNCGGIHAQFLAGVTPAPTSPPPAVVVLQGTNQAETPFLAGTNADHLNFNSDLCGATGCQGLLAQPAGSQLIVDTQFTTPQSIFGVKTDYNKSTFDVSFSNSSTCETVENSLWFGRQVLKIKEGGTVFFTDDVLSTAGSSAVAFGSREFYSVTALCARVAFASTEGVWPIHFNYVDFEIPTPAPTPTVAPTLVPTPPPTLPEPCQDCTYNGEVVGCRQIKNEATGKLECKTSDGAHFCKDPAFGDVDVVANCMPCIEGFTKKKYYRSGYYWRGTVSSCNACAETCKEKKLCRSFECSPSTLECDLQMNQNTNTYKFHEDFYFCAKNR